MKFIADVNIPQLLIRQLRNSSHYVLDIKKHDLKTSDTKIIEIAKKQSLIILTRDKDYVTLIQFPKYQVPVIAIRLIRQTKESLISNSLTIIRDDSAVSYPYPL